MEQQIAVRSCARDTEESKYRWNPTFCTEIGKDGAEIAPFGMVIV